MDILAIAALEAFTGPPDDNSQSNDTLQGSVEEDSSMVVAGVKRKAEGAEVSADDIDPSLSFEGASSTAIPHSQIPPLPPPPASRLSASLANILSGGTSSTTSTIPIATEQQQQQHHQQYQHQTHQALPPLMSSPYRTSSMPLPTASTSSPTAAGTSTSPSMDMTMVYYGPPVRLSEDSGLIRCICPYDDDDGFTIQCEHCFAWLHGLCVDISPETVPDIYTCPLCVSGGKIARYVEIRAARLQLLRKEAEDGLRRQRMKSNASFASSHNSNNLLSSDPAIPPTSELDEEYELLAKARGLAYQQSFDNNYTPTSATSYNQQQQPPPHRVAKPTQSPYYQREQLPVQQHTLGPSPFLHPPPQSASSAIPPHQQQQYPPHLHGAQSIPLTAQQARRAGSVVSNTSNTSGVPSTTVAGNAKRSKSSSPGGANVPQNNNNNAQHQPKLPKKRSSHVPQPSLPSIPQNSVLDSPSASVLGQKDATSQQDNTGLSAPPPPKKRRSASAKEKEKDNNEVPPSVLAATSGSLGTNASSLPYQNQTSTSILKETTVQATGQPVRKTRLAAASISASSDVNGVTSAPSVLNKAPAVSSGLATQVSTATSGPASGSKDAFLSDDEDSGIEDKYDPWQFEYTPINNLRYADRRVEQAVNELVEEFVEDERENLNGTLDNNEERTGTAGSRRASPLGNHSRNSSSRPSLLGASSHLPGIAHASRMASPVPSSGSSTPAYSSSGVASALAPPCLPLILPEPPISPYEFSSKLSVKPLATSSMSLAPPACTPFSGPTCVPSLMNPYPRPTIHGVFTSTAFNAGTLITFMHGEVISGEQYRDDPINQWHDLGVMKSHTRGIAQPWDLVLDQRRFADDSRFIRNGCHPNVFTKPVIIRKSRNNDAIGKKGRTPSRRKANQQKAVQEGGEFELVFGLYALQDIAKREELVLPFDWADDHVVHSLHTLLFSPSLVFPTIPTNVESETEDDGIPSTSSFTHLTASQKSQIAQCTKHLYRLSRLASQTCLTLLGTSLCACEKRRDCSIAWLWKLACFSESSSARSRGTIQLQDFDINGLRAACSSALATDDKDWAATLGVNGRMSNKKSSSRKRRADLGALIGLARGWEKPPVEPVSAIPPRLASEEVVESEEEQEQEEHAEEVKMQIDEPELMQDTHTPTVEKPTMDFGSAIQEDTASNSVPTSAEIDKADTPFQFAPPEQVEQGTLQSSAPIREEESKPDSKSLTPPDKEVAEVSPLSTRPNTAQSATSEKRRSSSRPVPVVQDSDSESDITEPLPSDHSDNEEEIKKSVRKSPVKEMSKKLGLDKRKNAEETSKTSRPSPSKADDMQVDDEEIVRPPKKKKLLKKIEAEKPSKVKLLQKSKKVEEEDDRTPGKKILKPKVKPTKSGDSSVVKERPSFGGLPSFRTKKQIDQAKELAAMKGQDDVVKPAEGAPVVAAPAAAAASPASVTTSAAAVPSQLDSLFDLPVPAVVSPPKPTVAEQAQTPSEPNKTPQVPEIALPVKESISEEAHLATDAMQVDQEPEATTQIAGLPVEAAPAQTASTIVAEEKPSAPAAPPIRRVSFQAYKKRVSIVPATSATPRDPITEEPSTMSPATDGSPAILAKTPILSVKPELTSEAVLGGDIVETPIVEKSAAQAEEAMSKPPVDVKADPVVEASPAAAQSPLQATTAVPPAAAKPRLSFAAYRQRASTGPKPLPVAVSPATVPTPLAAPASLPSVSPASKPAEQGKPLQDVEGAPKAVTEAKLIPTQQSAEAVDAKSSKLDTKKEEDEKEEGELVVDPNLEPGEVVADSAKDNSGTALGMRMGDFQQPEISKKGSNIKQSYTPPSRHRSLTPPKPVFTRQPEERSTKGDDAHQGRPATSHSTSGKPALTDGPPHGASSNANWAPLGRDRPTSPIMSTDRSDRGMSESSRYSANGASPPSHPRGFSRVSPRNSFQQPLPGSKPPTGPRSNAAPWPVRGRANSASGPGPGPGPVGRGGVTAGGANSDAIYGGGFGTAGSGGSSYRPGSSGRGDGPPQPARAVQPPSGPRALQGSSAGFPPPSRGRGRHEGAPPAPPRDRGWGGRGGRGRGGRDSDRGGYRGGYH